MYLPEITALYIPSPKRVSARPAASPIKYVLFDVGKYPFPSVPIGKPVIWVI